MQGIKAFAEARFRHTSCGIVQPSTISTPERDSCSIECTRIQLQRQPTTPTTTMNKCKQTQLMVVSLSLLLVLLLTVAVNNVNAAATVQVCGSALSDTLFLYCRGQFSGLPVHKRGSLDLFDYVEQQPGNELDLDDTMTHLSHGPAASSVLATRRLHRGVVDECCRKPCTYAEMSNYCLN